MSLVFWVKVAGWILAGVPFSLALAISFYMIIGASGDDESIKILVMIGVSTFLVGVVLLVISYFTNILNSIVL